MQNYLKSLKLHGGSKEGPTFENVQKYIKIEFSNTYHELVLIRMIPPKLCFSIKMLLFCRNFCKKKIAKIAASAAFSDLYPIKNEIKVFHTNNEIGSTEF